MSASLADETEYCRALIDHARYPIDCDDAAARAGAVQRTRAALSGDGCAVLDGFLSAQGRARILAEVHERRPRAYFSPATRTNVYFSSDDPSLPPAHPRRIFLERTNGFITSDEFDARTAARRLYCWPPLARFLAECLGRDEVFVYDDPVSNMIVNVGRPGTGFNWHFDTNEFTITLLLQPAQSGGKFEYSPNLRTARDERYADVTAVLRGARERVVSLDLRPGDLQLFLGRYSLHRVTTNTGARERLLLIMSFAERPGMIGSVHRTRVLYGKVTPAHLEAERQRVRNDTLMD